jgi:hypothetical protein
MLVELALSGFTDPPVALATLSAWLMVSAESFLATHTRGVFKMSFLWIGPSEVRILMAAGALRLLLGGWVTVLGLG